MDGFLTLVNDNNRQDDVVVEEEEALADQKRQEAEIHELLNLELDEYNFEDTFNETLSSSSSNDSTRTGTAVETVGSFASNETLKTLYDVRVRELRELSEASKRSEAEHAARKQSSDRRNLLLEAECQSVRRQLIERNDTIGVNREAIDRLTSEVDALKRDNAKLAAVGEDVASENRALATTVRQLERTIGELQSTPLYPTTVEASLSLEHERHVREVQKLRLVVDELNRKNAKLEENDGLLRRRLHETERRLADETQRPTTIERTCDERTTIEPTVDDSIVPRLRAELERTYKLQRRKDDTIDRLERTTRRLLDEATKSDEAIALLGKQLDVTNGSERTDGRRDDAKLLRCAKKIDDLKAERDDLRQRIDDARNVDEERSATNVVLSTQLRDLRIADELLIDGATRNDSTRRIADVNVATTKRRPTTTTTRRRVVFKRLLDERSKSLSLRRRLKRIVLRKNATIRRLAVEVDGLCRRNVSDRRSMANFVEVTKGLLERVNNEKETIERKYDACSTLCRQLKVYCETLAARHDRAMIKSDGAERTMRNCFAANEKSLASRRNVHHAFDATCRRLTEMNDNVDAAIARIIGEYDAESSSSSRRKENR